MTSRVALTRMSLLVFGLTGDLLVFPATESVEREATAATRTTIATTSTS